VSVVLPVGLALAGLFLFAIWRANRPRRGAHDMRRLAREELEQFGRARRELVVEGAWAEDVTVLVKAFERPLCAARAVQSVRAFYPTLRVLVCDDSREPLFENGAEPLPGVTWLTLDFELGHTLGAGRNFLVDRTETKYFFLMDDDHEMTEGTRLEAMHAFLEQSGFDIVGGAQGTEEYGAAVFEPRGDTVEQVFHRHHGLVSPGVVACDRVSNTFMARTEAVRKVYWEGRVYAHEHADFFLRASRAGLRIAQMGGTWVDHDRGCEEATGFLGAIVGRLVGNLIAHRDGRYRRLRMGGNDETTVATLRARDLYKKYVLDKNGVRDIVDVDRREDREALEALIGPPAGAGSPRS
jgi:GT2 family glycosyltransferase